MKLKRLMFGMGTVALAVASAAGSYNLELSQPTWVGSTQLKPGIYKVAMQGSTAVFTSGKKTVAEAPVSVQQGTHKVSSTEVETSNSKIQEIRPAGTKSRLIFSPGAGGDTSAH
jgi:hypothetical protein